MQCQRCEATNADGQKFCGQCGNQLIAPTPSPVVAVPGEEGAYYCGRHKKEATRVRCGRCETPICTRCAVHGPAGVRCRECARNRVPVRPMGVVHEVGRTIGDPQSAGRAVWYMAIWAFFISLFSGFLGGGRD
jgi:hypothetical protein